MLQDATLKGEAMKLSDQRLTSPAYNEKLYTALIQVLVSIITEINMSELTTKVVKQRIRQAASLSLFGDDGKFVLFQLEKGLFEGEIDVAFEKSFKLYV